MSGKREMDRDASGNDWAEFANWIVAGIVIFVLGAYANHYLASSGGAGLTGKQAPAIEMPAVRGDEEVGLSDHRGELVVLDFWATWCTVCERQMPKLQKAIQKSELTDEITVILVNTQESGENRRGKVERYLERRGLEYLTALDDGSVMQRYGVQGLPTMVIIDRQGRITYTGAGMHPAEDIVAHLREADQS
jgi:peroxiredoxin